MSIYKQKQIAGVFGALCTTLAVLPAQQDADLAGPGTGRLDQQSMPFTQLTSHGVEDGVLWVAGDRYKARYLNGGLEFTPALGSRAPYNMTWTYTFTGMERGNLPVTTRTGGVMPELSANGTQVRIPRGGGIQEVHHVRHDGLEVTYELVARPSGTGDLVVTADVVSELGAPVGRFGEEGLEFKADGIGGLRLSGVFGVDANGMRMSGTMGWDGRELTFTLPEAFLDEAVYPIVLDPVLGTIAEIDPINSGSNDTAQDVAFDLTNNVYAVCWQRVFSSTNSQIRGALFDGTTYASVGSTFIPISGATSGLAVKPSIANNNRTNQFLIAWVNSAGPFANRDIECRTLRPDGSVSGIVALAATSADELDVDVGGDARGLDDECLVVWADASQGIQSNQVTVSATGDPLPFTPGSVTTTASDRQPAIAKTMLSTRTLTVWRTSAGAIQGRFLSANGGPVGTEATISNSGADDSNPDVDGDGSVWMAVWQEEEAPNNGFHDIQCRRVLLGASSALSFPEPITALGLGSQSNDDERDPSVSVHKVRFVVCYEDNSTTTSGNSFAIAAYVGRDACRECEGRDTVSLGSGRNQMPVVCSRRSGGDANSDRGVIVWSQADVAPPFDGDGQIRGVQSAGDGQPILNTGGACGSAGTAAVLNGPAGVLGNLETEIQLSGASITSDFAFLWGAVAGQPRIACGPCQSLDPGVLSINIGTPVNLGGATVPVPTPCLSGLAGVPVEFQFVVFNTATNFCPLVPGVGTTDILSVTLSP